MHDNGGVGDHIAFKKRGAALELAANARAWALSASPTHQYKIVKGKAQLLCKHDLEVVARGLGRHVHLNMPTRQCLDAQRELGRAAPRPRRDGGRGRAAATGCF